MGHTLISYYRVEHEVKYEVSSLFVLPDLGNIHDFCLSCRTRMSLCIFQLGLGPLHFS